MKILILLAVLSATCLASYSESNCQYFRHIKPVENLNFLVCVIDVDLPPYIPIIQNTINEPVKGLIIGKATEVVDDSIFGTFSAVTYYGLLHHNIEHITKENLEYLTHLEGFDVTIGDLMKIDYDAFQDFQTLRDLDLSKNKLEYLHPQIFTSLGALEKVNLKGNQLRALELEMFANNKKLNFLNVQENKISYIDPRIFDGNFQLRELYFSGNLCLNMDYRPPIIQQLKFTFQQCRGNDEILDWLSEKRNEAESINYEDEKDDSDN